MTFERSIYRKAYYRSLNLILPKKELQFPSPNNGKKNIFIYFDYEREFSGYDTRVSDADIGEILDMLDERSILSTWFTVGKIFAKYPDSIKDIISRGHEIASHTYAHIPPLFTADRALGKDFESFNKTSGTVAHINGFHSPTGKWSLRSLKYLKTYNYIYDIISCPKDKECKPHYLRSGINNKIVRFYTYGDDWSLFKGDNDDQKTFEFYVELVKRIAPGNVGGLGFHPWVLFSNKNLLNGFNALLDYLGEQDDITLKPANHFADLLIKTNR